VTIVHKDKACTQVDIPDSEKKPRAIDPFVPPASPLQNTPVSQVATSIPHQPSGEDEDKKLPGQDAPTTKGSVPEFSSKPADGSSYASPINKGVEKESSGSTTAAHAPASGDGTVQSRATMDPPGSSASKPRLRLFEGPTPWFSNDDVTQETSTDGGSQPKAGTAPNVNTDMAPPTTQLAGRVQIAKTSLSIPQTPPGNNRTPFSTNTAPPTAGATGSKRKLLIAK
jgi:hypothetical protein